MKVENWLARAATAHPERVAIAGPEGALAYAELYERADAVARWLAGQGVREGQPVALALPAGVDFAVALHGCLLAGTPAVPVDPRLSAQERERVMREARVVVDPEAYALGSRPRGRTPGGLRGASHNLEAVAAVIHTSGTTGEPKPVRLTYGNWLWSALGSAAALGCEDQQRWLCALPLSHVGGLSILVRSAIYATTAVVHERFEATAVTAALMQDAITLVSLVATTLERLLDAGLECPPGLRCALVGGGPVPAALLERARAARVPLSQTYGCTEACSQVTTAAPGVEDDGGAGAPLFCTRVRTLPDGEILVRGPTVASGTLASDGWLHTGDLGRLDAGGRLHVTGRKADTIVTGAENVAPAEVEAVLGTHPGVADVAVHGRCDREWGEAVVASVVLRDDAPVSADELRRYCAERLAGYKVPKEIRLVADLPRTPSGKLLRRELS